MKKILFVIGQMRIGGVSKALLELLTCLDGNDQYEVSLLCFDQDGVFFQKVPNSIKIVPSTPLLKMTENSASDISAEGTRYRIIRKVCSAWSKIFSKKVPAILITMFSGKLAEEYDCAIAYTHPMEAHMFCNLGAEYVCNCVKAKNKAIFIHCDYLAYGGYGKLNNELLGRFDKIAAVSDSVGKRICEALPQVAEKVTTVRNCHDFAAIFEMANDKPVEYGHKVNVVTVARLSGEKGLERCIPIFAALQKEGFDVSWHLVGGGPLESHLREMISAHHAEDYIILEGEHANSYRYMKNADYLLLPSYHEAAPMVFDEAGCLGIPIISTDTLSAIELVKERNLGFVCGTDDASLYQTIKNAVMRVYCQDKMQIYFNASNEEAISSFIKLCGV